MISALKKRVDRSESLSSLNYFKGQVLYRLGLSSHLSGATHLNFSTEQSVSYIKQVVDDYLRYAAADPQYLSGKDVLEVGPGDNLGVAIGLIAKGVRSVTCLDRFKPRHDEQRNAQIYRALIAGSNAEEQARINQVVQFEGHRICLDTERIISRYGFPIEQAAEHMSSRRFDLIISRAVLEHVSDLESAWLSMVKLLKPDGQMWHKVDFRNHGKFDQFHPLHFLTISESTWNLITSPDPTLNRERLPTYMRLASCYFDNIKVFYTHILEDREVQPHSEQLTFGTDYGLSELERLAEIRPLLSHRFRELTDEDLLISGIFLICKGRKPTLT